MALTMLGLKLTSRIEDRQMLRRNMDQAARDVYFQEMTSHWRCVAQLAGASGSLAYLAYFRDFYFSLHAAACGPRVCVHSPNKAPLISRIPTTKACTLLAALNWVELPQCFQTFLNVVVVSMSSPIIPLSFDRLFGAGDT